MVFTWSCHATRQPGHVTFLREGLMVSAEVPLLKCDKPIDELLQMAVKNINSDGDHSQ